MSELEEVQREKYSIMEQRDESQILDHLKGNYLQEFVYSFKVSGREVTGISWAGVKEIASRMGGIDVESCDIEDKEDRWMVKVKASDTVRGNTRFGVSTQKKKMKLKDGSEIPDEFALQKAVSKAQRNAIRGLIPEMFIKLLIKGSLSEIKVVSDKSSITEAVQQQVEPKREPGQKHLSPDAIHPDEIADKLREKGLNPNILIYDLEENEYVITPKEFMGPKWGNYATVLGSLKFNWIPKSDEKPGHWTRSR